MLDYKSIYNSVHTQGPHKMYNEFRVEYGGRNVDKVIKRDLIGNYGDSKTCIKTRDGRLLKKPTARTQWIVVGLFITWPMQ